ncbi:MAG TPA: hypothetical protein EYQ66_02650 [Myxococcales bacterium]|jgi:hypothetical protein|nr:hypothetical protein [Myxococcales bacterium]
MKPAIPFVNLNSPIGWAGKLATTALVAALIVVVSDPVLACTVCSGGQEEASRKAFVGTTALLTFLPMVVAGSAIWFFVRRTLAQERQDAEAQLAAGTTGTGNVA